MHEGLEMVKGRDIVVSVLISCTLFGLGYYLGVRRMDKKSVTLIQSVADHHMLSEADLAAYELNLIDKKQMGKVEKSLLYLMDAELWGIQLDTTTGDEDLIDQSAIDKYTWRQYLTRIKACALRKNQLKTANRAEDILRWLGDGGKQSASKSR